MRTIGALAHALGLEAAGSLELSVRGLAEPACAQPDQLALAMAPKFAAALAQGRAQAAVLWPGADWRGLGLRAALFAPRPRFALAGLTRVFAPPVAAPPGIHQTAVVEPSARLGAEVAIGPFAVIAARVRLGPRSRVLAHVSIGEDAEIGEDAVLHPGVRIGPRVRIGARFIAHPGAVIGADGFSYATAEEGVVEAARTGGPLEAAGAETHAKIHSLGSVSIGDDVEVGANACIDRGTLGDTVVGDGTKIDNHVQVGHNVRIGRACLLCGHVAIGGSTVIGDRVVLGGKAAIADHLTIGSNVVITGHSGVASNVPPNRVMMGYPAVRLEQNVEMYKALRRLPRLLARLEAAEKRVSNPGPSD